MTDPAVPTPKGPWFNRFLIRTLTVILGVLVYWLLGFLTQDIRTLDGPDYEAIEKRHVPESLRENERLRRAEMVTVQRQISQRNETRQVVSDSSRNLQQTIGQLLELRKAGMERNAAMSESDQAHFASALNLFLEQQRRYQEISQSGAELLQRQQDLQRELDDLDQQLERAREPARREHERAMESHRLRLAGIQLAVLLPLLAVAAWLLRGRAGAYQPLMAAVGVATLLKVGMVMHEYFPRRYFKYILITALILTVGRFLIHQIRRVTRPQRDWLLRQYREAYERFLCPVCEYPIRTGPRRFLYWTRRTVNKLVVPTGPDNAPEPYTCPCCGTGLFEACSSCGHVRHSLLPNCTGCGAAK